MSRFHKHLEDLQGKSRLRRLSSVPGIDLTSNDYLGFCDHPFLKNAAQDALDKGIPLGAGGSRLLRGHTRYHEALEEKAANFFGYQKALYFSTGYQANSAIFSALTSRHDVIIFDEHVHASAREAIHFSPAQKIKIPHNDLDRFENALKKASGERKSDGMIWVAVESLYSMDGDFVPLEALHSLSNKYGAFLIVDEAHATGIYGSHGEGVCTPAMQKADNILALHTCGKALGLSGGMLCASEEIIDMIINTARPFIYSTAPSPFQAYMVEHSLDLCRSSIGEAQRQKLNEIVAATQKYYPSTQSQIVPVIIGGDEETLRSASALQQEGYDVRAIRPPTVPAGTARLRVSLNSNLSEQIISQFFVSLEQHMTNTDQEHMVDVA